MLGSLLQSSYTVQLDHGSARRRRLAWRRQTWCRNRHEISVVELFAVRKQTSSLECSVTEPSPPRGHSHLPASPRIANPLATISIFLTFCEITAGIAATQTAGGVHTLLAVFSVSFPVAISVGLFVLLWKKPEVLYAPGDYPAQTPIRDYVEAVRGGTLSATSWK